MADSVDATLYLSSDIGPLQGSVIGGEGLQKIVAHVRCSKRRFLIDKGCIECFIAPEQRLVGTWAVIVHRYLAKRLGVRKASIREIRSGNGRTCGEPSNL